MLATPAATQRLRSLSLIGREAFAIEGCSAPTPAQKALKPPPVPVDSTIGVPKDVVAPKRSAIVRENGATVEEPTILIFCSAEAVPATGAAWEAESSSSCDRSLCPQAAAAINIAAGMAALKKPLNMMCLRLFGPQ